MTRRELASRIEHTFLKPDGEKDAIARLCDEALKYKFACVVVNPANVEEAAKRLQGSDVRVGTVAGFPLGQNTATLKVCEGLEAVQMGAVDVDFVLNVRALKYRPADYVQEALDLANLRIKEANPLAITKLILECCYLTDDEKVLACRLAKKAGFDFVKTSTGFGLGGATVEDVALMRKTVGKRMGVKAAGGIRTLEDALRMVEAGADRIGCSAGVQIIETIP